MLILEGEAQCHCCCSLVHLLNYGWRYCYLDSFSSRSVAFQFHLECVPCGTRFLMYINNLAIRTQTIKRNRSDWYGSNSTQPQNWCNTLPINKHDTTHSCGMNKWLNYATNQTMFTVFTSLTWGSTWGPHLTQSHTHLTCLNFKYLLCWMHSCVQSTTKHDRKIVIHLPIDRRNGLCKIPLNAKLSVSPTPKQENIAIMRIKPHYHQNWYSTYMLQHSDLCHPPGYMQLKTGSFNHGQD